MSTLNHLSHLKVALLARLALASVDHQRLQLRHAEGDDHRLVLLIVSHHCRIDIVLLQYLLSILLSSGIVEKYCHFRYPQPGSSLVVV